DLFDRAQPIPGVSWSQNLATWYATAAPGEPSHFSNGASAVRSAWWRWTAQLDGEIKVKTSGDAAVAVYTGDQVNALTLVGGRAASLSVDVVAGTTYRI